jgi:hypothetical protein
VNDDQKPSLLVPSKSYPTFFRFAVLMVNNGNGQGIQEKLGSTLEGDSVLAMILPRFNGIPVKSATQFFVP